VPRADPVVPGMLAGCQVHDHVEGTGGDHQQQPNASQRREGGCLENEPFAVFYRQHVLVIHAWAERVKSIANEIA